MPNTKTLSLLCGLVLVTIIAALTASAQSSAFTYQGKLTSGGTDGAGAFDFKFRLYDLAAGGAQQGAELVRDDVAVTAGVFTVTLDFGNQFAAAGERWLEIEVRDGASNGAYTLLSPRQRISSSPFSVQTINAQFAVTAGNAQAVGGIPAANIVNTSDPRLTDARPPTAGSENYIQNTNTQQAASNFNISGTGKAGMIDAATYSVSGFPFIKVGGPGNASMQLGISAGGNIDSAFQNLFVGSRAGFSNSTGGTNVFVGNDAGYFNSTGSSNSLFGWNAGLRTGAGSRNAIFGYQSGNNTTSSDNSFFGADSGTVNTIGSNLTLLGSSSNVGQSNLVNATAIGSRSFVVQSNSLVLGSINGQNGATADTNVGIGTTAPSRKLHVVGNSLFAGELKASYFDSDTHYRIRGSKMLSIDGTDNVFLGTNSGNLNTGVFNAFVGAWAGWSNTSGSSNSFFGSSAGSSNSSGTQNAFFGNGSGRNNSTGGLNTFLGYISGYENTTGISNSFVGSSAGQQNTTGRDNTFVGQSSGDTNTVGTQNTTVGSFADVGSGNLTNSTAIGSRALVSQSNSLVLGSINGVNSATASTNVGIGTTAPNFRFHVKADGQDGIKIQHTGTGAFPQLRFTDTNDVFKASIGVDTSNTGSMNFFVNGADRIILKSNGIVQIPGGVLINNPNTLVITSPNGACWGISVNNSGALSTFPVNPCP